MSNEPKPGIGFLASVPAKGRLEATANPPPAPVVNNYYFSFSSGALEALKEVLVWAVVLVVVVTIFRYGPKLLG